MTVFSPLPVERPSALICYPVEFLDGYDRNINGPHVTLLYFPDVTENAMDQAEWGKTELIYALRQLNLKRRYQIANVMGVDAFGPDKNVPVLRVSTGEYIGIPDITVKVRSHLDEKGMNADRSYPINPHVTVPLETLIAPPTKVLLRPMELWWRDDEPVVI